MGRGGAAYKLSDYWELNKESWASFEPQPSAASETPSQVDLTSSASLAATLQLLPVVTVGMLRKAGVSSGAGTTPGNMTLDEFSDYVCCLKKKLSPEEFERVKPALRDLLQELLTTPLRDNEEIVVPTGALFIEALPGVHPLLEDFKLMHRAIDVKRAQAEVRKMEMENVRYAARLLSDELEDPEIEKKIVVEGSVNPAIDVDNP